VAGRLHRREAGGARATLQAVRRPEHLSQALGALRAARPLQRDEALLQRPDAVGEVARERGPQGPQERLGVHRVTARPS
jgi:hypothetical protein